MALFKPPTRKQSAKFKPKKKKRTLKNPITTEAYHKEILHRLGYKTWQVDDIEETIITALDKYYANAGVFDTFSCKGVLYHPKDPACTEWCKIRRRCMAKFVNDLDPNATTSTGATIECTLLTKKLKFQMGLVNIKEYDSTKREKVLPGVVVRESIQGGPSLIGLVIQDLIATYTDRWVTIEEIRQILLTHNPNLTLKESIRWSMAFLVAVKGEVLDHV